MSTTVSENVQEREAIERNGNEIGVDSRRPRLVGTFWGFRRPWLPDRQGNTATNQHQHLADVSNVLPHHTTFPSLIIDNAVGADHDNSDSSHSGHLSATQLNNRCFEPARRVLAIFGGNSRRERQQQHHQQQQRRCRVSLGVAANARNIANPYSEQLSNYRDFFPICNRTLNTVRHISTSNVESDEEEIPERQEYDASTREASLGLMESGWRNALKSMNNYSFELFPPKKESIIKEGWVWKLSEYLDIFRRRYAILISDGDLLFYASPNDLGVRGPTESFKVGDYAFAPDCGMRHPRRLEIESGVRTRSMTVCLVANSVLEKMDWIEMLICVLTSTSHRVFHYNPEVQCAIRVSGQSHLADVASSMAPYIVHELVQVVAVKLIRSLPMVASAA